MDESNVEHTMIHEMGHALGINGHTSGSTNIMFHRTNDSNKYILDLTNVDTRLLKQLYKENYDYDGYNDETE